MGAAPRPDEVAMNRDPHHSDQSATVQNRRDAFVRPLTNRLHRRGNAGSTEQKKRTAMSASGMPVEPTDAIETSQIADRKTAAEALTVVRDGVITGEGPTTRGRIHFSRALDADDAAWCARILTAAAVEAQPVSRAEAEALFEIDDAATERSDDGLFDDLFARSIVHHAASASGLPVP